MGGIIKRSKSGGHDLAPEPIREILLACGCLTDAQPDIATPKRKWWCCSGYQTGRLRPLEKKAA
jgi:hypothetical protein